MGGGPEAGRKQPPGVHTGPHPRQAPWLCQAAAETSTDHVAGTWGWFRIGGARRCNHTKQESQKQGMTTRSPEADPMGGLRVSQVPRVSRRVSIPSEWV